VHTIEEGPDEESITVKVAHQDVLEQEKAPGRDIFSQGLIRALAWDSETGQGYQARNSQDSEAIVNLGDSWIHYLHLSMRLSGYDQMTDCGGGETVTAVIE
jgi:hypothetical protein